MDLRCEAKPATSISAYALNRLSLANDWPLICDPRCRFDDEKLYGVERAWRSKSGNGIPYRRDMTARLLQPYIPQLSIYERHGTPGGAARYRVRLMGTNAVLFTTEMTGRFLDEVIPAPYLPRWYALGETIFTHGGPLRILHRGDSFGKKYVVGEGFTAPLRSSDGKTDMIMAVITYTGTEPWAAVAAHTRQEMQTSL